MYNVSFTQSRRVSQLYTTEDLSFSRSWLCLSMKVPITILVDIKDFLDLDTFI